MPQLPNKNLSATYGTRPSSCSSEVSQRPPDSLFIFFLPMSGHSQSPDHAAAGAWKTSLTLLLYFPPKAAATMLPWPDSGSPATTHNTALLLPCPVWPWHGLGRLPAVLTPPDASFPPLPCRALRKVPECSKPGLLALVWQSPHSSSLTYASFCSCTPFHTHGLLCLWRKQRSHVVQHKFGIHPVQTPGSEGWGLDTRQGFLKDAGDPIKRQADVSSSSGEQSGKY